ncbi:MAG: beta-ketoacyl-[acyl-carrier-protein] synthase family protein [Planctomycetes bacterium]|nr:beta-ketoacyl-[acyl-carrier-protein] synthase family protein [Planctomycetota bacterium]
MNRPPSTQVVITGAGIISAIGRGQAETLASLREGRIGVRPITAFDSAPFGVRVAGEVPDFPPAELREDPGWRRCDRGTLLALVAMREAWEEASLARGERPPPPPNRRACILGTTLGGMNRGLAYLEERARRPPGRARLSLLRDYLPGTQIDRLAAAFGCEGLQLAISNACASGTHAIGLAARLIAAGEIDLAIAGGYDPLCPFTHAGFGSLQLLARDGVCRPFDAGRTGMLLGEGAGVLVLERAARAAPLECAAEAAPRPPFPPVSLAGYGEAGDAFHLTRPDPSGAGAAAAMRAALESAALSPERVDYVNAHGTGTPSNDLMEAVALRTVFAGALERLPVSSTKSMTGHCLGGAGGVEAVISLLALRYGVIPPTATLERPDPACAGLDLVAGSSRRADLQTALSASFGFGGQNAAIVLQKQPGPGDRPGPKLNPLPR